MPENASVLHTLLLIAVIAVLTLLLRALPFILFRKGNTPAIITYLGRVMPPAVIGMLVVYCFKDISLSSPKELAAALVSALVVVLLHIWRKNSLISIGAGTLCYMLFVQLLFK